MRQLSPNYRTDDAAGISDDIKKYLDDNYLKKLENLDRTNPKLLVVFSGGNAVGKSTISQLIKEKFGALVLENDAIKRCLLEGKPEIDRNELNKLTWQYSMKLYEELGAHTKNGLVVRDGIIDWYYDRILPVFENNYQLFIIAFDLSPEKTKELIKRRGDTPTAKEERFYVLLNDHEIHTKRFRSQYTPDVILDDKHVFDHELVLEKLSRRLNALKVL